MKKGSVTVEAAIALPIFLCVVISIVFIIKIIYVNGMIQHALMETADEMASTAYIYHVSGLRDLHDTARNSINSRSDVFKEHIDTVFDTYNSITDLSGSIGQGTGNLTDTTIDAAKNISDNPLDELKNAAAYISRGSFNDVKTELLTPLAKQYMKKYLASGSSLEVGKRLEALNILGGMDGLDFNDSGFFEDENEDIDIVVRYTMDFPVPIKILPKLEFVQSATARAWMGGDETKGVIDEGNSSTADDIWSLGNFERGRKIRTAFGGSLPDNFPVIARYEAGTATMIKSMDLTAKSYQSSANVKKELEENISNLAEYKGQNEPWGSSDIVIKSVDIKRKELILVIPKNEITAQIEDALQDCVKKAVSEGITLKIERYGMKKIAEVNEK